MFGWKGSFFNHQKLGVTCAIEDLKPLSELGCPTSELVAWWIWHLSLPSDVGQEPYSRTRWYKYLFLWGHVASLLGFLTVGSRPERAPRSSRRVPTGAVRARRAGSAPSQVRFLEDRPGWEQDRHDHRLGPKESGPTNGTAERGTAHAGCVVGTGQSAQPTTAVWGP